MEPRIRTILLLLLGAALALGAGCVYVAIQAYISFLEQPPEAEKPHLYATPQLLKLEPCELSPSTTVTLAGFAFDTPWTAIDETQPDDEDGIKVVKFTTEQAIVASDMNEVFQAVGNLRSENPQTRQMLESMMGPTALESNYGFISAVVATTPSDVAILRFPTKTLGARMLLGLKDSLASNAATGLFSFHTNHVRGFQLGDPSKTNAVDIIVFDERDAPLHLMIGVKEDSTVRVSQGELSCIIQSIRPADEAKEQIQQKGWKRARNRVK
jgi:hypothetical protein